MANDINDILQICLETIQNGEATLDTILERYPELADELQPQLEAAVWLHQRAESFGPRPGFVRASRSRLVNRIQT